MYIHIKWWWYVSHCPFAIFHFSQWKFYDGNLLRLNAKWSAWAAFWYLPRRQTMTSRCGNVKIYREIVHKTHTITHFLYSLSLPSALALLAEGTREMFSILTVHMSFPVHIHIYSTSACVYYVEHVWQSRCHEYTKYSIYYIYISFIFSFAAWLST